NATSYNASGLAPGVTYFWRVFAVSEGALSTALSGSQATSPAGNIISTGAGGNWSSPATWVGGVVPGPGDNATIATGATVTIDSSNCLNLTIQTGATLQYEATTARTLTVGQTATVNSGGVFQSNPAGTQTGHVLSVGGDLINNGTIDFSTNANTAAAGIVFTGATDAAFTLGGGSTTDLKQTAGVTVNKGTNNTPVLTFTPGGTLTVLGANTVGFLTITNGTFKVGGTNAFSNPLFNVAAYSIPATGGFWMDNPNATVVGQNGSPTLTGLFRMSQGTHNIGTSSGNSMGFASGANINVEGGAINATGRFGVAASGNAITYNQTAGTITVCTVGNASSTLASFDLGTGVGTTNITGGTIIVQLANTSGAGPRDYRNQSGLTGTTTVTGGTVQMGNAASGVAKAFSIAGVFPNLVISNASANHSATFLAPAVFNNITRNILINPGTTLNIGNNVFLMNGTTLTNNGTLTANGASSNFVWFLTTAPQLYTGSGVVTAPVTNFAIQADMGLTIDLASSNIVVGAIRLFTGSLINSNKITLGNGGATTGIVQIGNTTTPTPAGSFDVPFTFNLGTGGQTLSYLRTTLTRTTGPEINPTRILTSMTYDDNDPTHSLTIAGGDLSLSATATALTMTNGRIITGANTLIMTSGTGTVTRTNGFVDGNFRKTYAAAATKLFEVGTANGFSPVNVNITAGTFPAVFTVKAVQGPQPNILTPSHALQRYWVLTGTGVTADLTFNYLDPPDVPGTAVEANFVILKYDGSFTMPGGSVNTAANTATITGVTSFSDWTLGEPGAPTDVALNWFTADGFSAGPSSPNGGALLKWQTGLEVANLGFNIYRDEAGKRVRVNPDIIAGSAFFVGARTVLGAGRSYVWRDTQGASSDAQYWLESIDINGFSSWYGPVRSAGDRRMAGSVEPNSKLMKDLGGSQADAGVPVESKAQQVKVNAAGLTLQAAAASQASVKIGVRNEGWYRITQSELAAAGLDSSANPVMLQLLVDGQEQPINVQTEDGRLTAVEFYGIGADSPYTGLRTYWLSAGEQPGKRIEQQKSEGSAPAGGSFSYAIERRDRTIYFPALRNGEKENFFGSVIARDPVEQLLNVQRLDAESNASATLEVALQGVTFVGHSINVQLNGSNVGAISFNGQSSGSGRFNPSPSLLKEGQNVVRLIAQGGATDVSLVEFIRLTYPHRYTAEGDTLRLTVAGKQQITIDGFSNSGIRVLDVTNPASVQELIGTVRPEKDGHAVALNIQSSGQRTLLAMAGGLARPASLEANIPSSWRQPANGANLLILTRRDFFSSLAPLMQLRQKQGYSVALVDINDVYDEFSFGQKTPQAVRDFCAYASANWKKTPHFVMLAGDASFDPKNYLGFGDTDLIPTKLVDTQLMETASDDWLVDFNGDALPDMAIGRLPVRTASEALALASKIVGYNLQQPAERLLLVSDHNDTFDFGSASNSLRGLIPSDIRVESVDRAQVDDATAKALIIEGINRGQLIVNYVGHGSVNQWRGNILTSEDAAALTNNGDLSLFVMMTCLNGYFQDASLDSIGESLLKAEGGAVAVWGSSGMTTPDIQSILNQQAYRLIFNTAPMTMGDATALAKAAVANTDVRRTWILLGDPTMRLSR
ncbi:MAG TPA: C25 family cysteine peptidase, partial [Blastocatellia bacterium]|nr:C25 family cysteine peptidase [Blastocatellia bacterium]